MTYPTRVQHGQWGSPTYNSWSNMIQRCRNPHATGYNYYGGRGIKVCDEWVGEGGFIQFVSDMGTCPEGLSLDRIDNDGDYTPENCRWATWSTQVKNRRRPAHYDRGLTIPICGHSDRRTHGYGLCPECYHIRIRKPRLKTQGV